MEQVLTLEILGQPFSFKTDVDVTDAKAVADYVVASVDRASSQCGHKAAGSDKRAILILTALNITNEFFELKKRHQQLLQDLDKRSEDLLKTLESKIANVSSTAIEKGCGTLGKGEVRHGGTGGPVS